jgi:hypothetical protein
MKRLPIGELVEKTVYQTEGGLYMKVSDKKHVPVKLARNAKSVIKKGSPIELSPTEEVFVLNMEVRDG